MQKQLKDRRKDTLLVYFIWPQLMWLVVAAYALSQPPVVVGSVSILLVVAGLIACSRRE